MTDPHDLSILRDLARQYRDAASHDVHDQRRQLWRDHNSLRPTRPPVLIRCGLWNTWCAALFADEHMKCRDPFYRDVERHLRVELFRFSLGDDWILEPWLPLQARTRAARFGKWGVDVGATSPDFEGGARKFDPPLKEPSDLANLRPLNIAIDEDATARDAARLHDAVGDLLAVDVRRAPGSFASDISWDLGMLRGIEQIMIDMLDNPDWLHRLAAFLRDGLLAAQADAERRGYWTRTAGNNQTLCYCHELPDPAPNSAPCTRRDLWGFLAAQEFALISPAMHDEFLLRYQVPLLENFGLSSYGCCEDLTLKIGLLKKVKNLRRIAVTPWANVARCAEQIGRDYVMSWRPNPTNMVSAGFDETQVRRILRDGLHAARGCRVEIVLKDVETVEGDITRLHRWVHIAKEEAERHGAQ